MKCIHDIDVMRLLIHYCFLPFYCLCLSGNWWTTAAATGGQQRPQLVDDGGCLPIFLHKWFTDRFSLSFLFTAIKLRGP
jgi:hypothetical protein